MDPDTPELSKITRRQGLNWRMWLVTALFESALIVLSVILGLMLTGWAQDQRDTQRVHEMRDYIEQEITANRALVVSVDYLPHHRNLAKQIDEAAQVNNITLQQAAPTFSAIMRTGVHLVPVDDSVWRSVSAGDLLEHLPPEQVFAMARTYRAHEDLHLINQTMLGLLTQIPAALTRGDPPAGSIRQLQLTMNDVVAAEEALVQHYDQTLGLLRDARKK